MEQLLDLGKLSQYRFQKISVSIADLSPAGSYSNNVQLDRAFNKILGIAYFEKLDGGIPNDYDIGAKTDRQTWFDPINIKAWKAEEGVGPMFKYYSVNIPYASGDTFYALITTGQPLAGSDLTGQMVLILSKDLTELPR